MIKKPQNLPKGSSKESNTEAKEYDFLSKEETIYLRDTEGNIQPVEGIVEVHDLDIDQEIREETMLLAQMINKQKALEKLLVKPDYKNEEEMITNYQKALESSDDSKQTAGLARMKQSIIFNARAKEDYDRARKDIIYLENTNQQSRELIFQLKKTLNSQIKRFKIKYIPCVIGEATNLQQNKYFDGTLYESDKTTSDVLTPDQHLILHKCVVPKYIEDEVKTLKKDYLTSISRSILKGSGLFPQNYRELLLDLISSKKKKSINDINNS